MGRGWAGAVVQPLRALTAPPEDLSSDQLAVTIVPIQYSLLVSLGTRHSCDAYTYMKTKSIHKIKVNLKKKERQTHTGRPHHSPRGKQRSHHV